MTSSPTTPATNPDLAGQLLDLGLRGLAAELDDFVARATTPDEARPEGEDVLVEPAPHVDLGPDRRGVADGATEVLQQAPGGNERCQHRQRDDKGRQRLAPEDPRYYPAGEGEARHPRHEGHQAHDGGGHDAQAKATRHGEQAEAKVHL